MTVFRETLHVDLVDNVWLAGEQRLAARVAPDDPRASYRGDYRFATPPHTDQDCPFKDGPVRKMTHVPKRP